MSTPTSEQIEKHPFPENEERRYFLKTHRLEQIVYRVTDDDYVSGIWVHKPDRWTHMLPVRASDVSGFPEITESCAQALIEQAGGVW